MSFSLPPSDRDLEDELRHHLLECADLLVAQGWDEESARDEAQRRFGDRDAVCAELMAVRKEGAIQMRFAGWLRLLAADARYALRGLRANPTFSLSVITTVALGIGASASIFAVIDAVLLRPIPYEDASRWVELNRVLPNGEATGGMSGEGVSAWTDAAGDVFDRWVGFLSLTLVRVDGPQAEALSVVAVTPGAERHLGIPLRLGRGILAEDAVPGAPPVAVLGRAYWERLGADPDILGRTVRLESGPVTVVGVLGGAVRFPLMGGDREMWLPLRTDFSAADRPGRGVQALWARLAPGLSREVAQERVDALTSSLSENGTSRDTWQLRILPLGGYRASPDVARSLWTLSATVSAILLIALLNAVNLVLVRATSRRREMAIRIAIGGSRYAILRQLLGEGLVLGVLGGVAAVGLAWLTVEALGGMFPSSLLFFSPHALTVESRTLLVAFGASLTAGILLGVVPGMTALRGECSADALAGRGATDAPRAGRVRNMMVVVQVALSMTLLAAAGLLVNSLTRLLAVDEGFEYERVALASIMLSPTRYPDGATRSTFLAELESRLELDPYVESVAISTGAGFSFDAVLEAEGHAPNTEQPGLIPFLAVGEDYLPTLGMSLVAGRGMQRTDAETDNVLIDEDLARFLWGSSDVVGRRFRIVEHEKWLTVVGVVEELMLMGRDERDGPHQFLTARSPNETGSYVEVAMRARTDPGQLLPVFRETLRELDAEQWIWKLHTGADMLAAEEDSPRFLVAVMGALALIAVSLSAVGLYGVLSYSVGRRSKELGIRIALGAGVGRLRADVLTEGLRMTAIGIVLGTGAALVASQSIEGLLYGVGGRDPATLAATAGLLFGVAGVAAYIPARRATQVDPLCVLNSE